MPPTLDLNVALAVDQFVKDIAAAKSPQEAFTEIADLFEQNDGLYEGIHAAKAEAGLPARNPGPDGASMAEKYLRNTANATGDYVRGVQNPRRNPKQAALAAAGKWQNQVQKAIQEGRFAKGVQRYDEAEAVRAATADGGAAYAAGIQKRAGKVQAAMQRLAPLLAAVSQSVQALPQDTDAQREQRLLQARKMMINVGKQLKGGA